MSDKRRELLNQSVAALQQAAASGYIVRGEPIMTHQEVIAGPRAGVVCLYAGLATGPLYRALSADNAALARQFIAWRFPGAPAVYLDGHALRIEATWPPELARANVALRDIQTAPRSDGRWTVGLSEHGWTVVGGMNDTTPNWLIAGTTGSGKTTTLLSAGLQLSKQDVRMVLIDGKLGAGLGPLVGLNGVVGPLATEIAAARNALGWVHEELTRRYQAIAADAQAAGSFTRLAVLFDEFQEFTGDATVTELLRRIASRGRAAKIGCLLSTHHPTVAAFGDDSSLKRCLPGRVALRVLDAKASEVVIGGANPRADRLAGAGDAYVIGGLVHRTQVAYIDRSDLDAVSRVDPLLEGWPEFASEDVGQDPRPRWAYSGEELAYGLAAAVRGWGRGQLQTAMVEDDMPRPGSDRADRLMRLGRAQKAALSGLGLETVEMADG